MINNEEKERIKECFDELTEFLIWLEEHEPEDEMIWKKDWWERNVLIKERLLKKLFGLNYKIVGSHYSKSIECPVVLINYKGVDIILQYNFYHWQIMVKSPIKLKLEDLELYNADDNYLYYQGIPEEYRFKKYSKNKCNKNFAISMPDDLYDVYGFMIMLKKVIDNYVKDYTLEDFE